MDADIVMDQSRESKPVKAGNLNAELSLDAYKLFSESSKRSLLDKPTSGMPLSEKVALGGEILSRVPGKTMDQIAFDLEHNQGAVLQRMGSGAAIGLAGTALLRFAPRLGYVGGALLMAKQTYDGISGLAGFSRDADRLSSSNLNLVRQDFVEKKSSALASGTANLVEGAPGLIGGGYAATKLFGTPLVYSRSAAVVTEKIVDPIRNRAAFVGPGTEALPASLGRADKVDLLEMAKTLSARPGHVYNGREAGSVVDLAGMRVSRSKYGTETGLAALPAPNKAETLTFHTHPLARGAHPGPEDIAATSHLGLISSGSQYGLFLGERGQMLKLLKSGQTAEHSPTLRALLFDEKTGTATRLLGTWNKADRHWVLTERSGLNYEKTIEALRNLDTRNSEKVWELITRLPADKS
ncbi:MAG: hypothetical protein J0M35_15905 [Candidatus Obscuribacter phosphatis]|uniref:Uncharacterized protein n=1 Tax=Candidatus Obscuribacter phosphatis TaxID=1906157 RepID=A0A8J7TN98_9BACT|nr:hypothetical protein [Candidatus Obscuribacter phosphatis]